MGPKIFYTNKRVTFLFFFTTNFVVFYFFYPKCLSSVTFFIKNVSSSYCAKKKIDYSGAFYQQIKIKVSPLNWLVTNNPPNRSKKRQWFASCTAIAHVPTKRFCLCRKIINSRFSDWNQLERGYSRLGMVFGLF